MSPDPQAPATIEEAADLALSRSFRRVAAALARVAGFVLDLPDLSPRWTPELFAILDRDGPPTDLAEGLLQFDGGDAALLDAGIRRCAQDGTPVDLTLRMRSFRDRPMHVRVVCEAERDADDRIARVVGALQDITEQHRTAESARAIAERLETTLESITDALYIVDRDWRFTFLNRRAEALVHRTREELLGKVIWEEFPEAVGTEVDVRYHQAVAEGTTQVIEEFFYPPLDTWFGIHAYPSSLGLAVYFQDIGERKAMQAALLRSQRLQAIGTLAGGIAHDLNNVLTPITMAVGVLRHGEHDPRRRELLDVIASSAAHGAEVVRQILTSARGVEGERLPLDVRDLLADVERIARDAFLRGIAVVHEEAEDLWPVLGDATQLHQVLLNLCVNARDAMPHGGTLALRASNVDVDEQYSAMAEGADPGRYVCVVVEDDGEGMAPEVVDRVFEPFFTTKPLGEGTGLGLPTSAGIVRSHGGFMRITSEPGRGTRVLIHLPAAAVQQVTGPAVEPAVPRGDGQVVLVVDDEDHVRATIAQALEVHGYRALVAAGGAQAVELLAADPSAVDLVLTDMMMPEVDGPTTILALRGLRPDLPVVAASGLFTPDDTAQAADMGISRCLPKPFTTAALLQAVADALA